MEQKNIVPVPKSKADSHDEMLITSSQHSKNKKGMADQLRKEIDLLLSKQYKAEVEARHASEEYESLKTKGKNYEDEADFHWKSYKTWSSEVKRLIEEIALKLKAVQKFESPSKKMEEPKFIDKMK